MITAAMPPSTLSTTFLSVSANKVHLTDDVTRGRVTSASFPASDRQLVATVAGQVSPVPEVQQSTTPSWNMLQALPARTIVPVASGHAPSGLTMQSLHTVTG